MMDVLIVGTGALATLFAARLASTGHRITMLGTWPEGLSALRTNGARFVDENGKEQTFPVQAIDNPSQSRGAKHALVLVKSWQTERAALQLKDCLAADGLAVTLQNGLGNREILAKVLGESRVALGTTTTGATLVGPGLVKAGGEGVISIEAHKALGPVEEALKSANFKVNIVNDARSLVWGKLVINAAINPLTALLRVSNGELLNRPSAHNLMRALAQEAAQVASAERIKLAFSDPAASAEEVARKTAANHSSMFQDIQRSAPTEIDAICGAITRAAHEHGIPTPLNEACWQLVKALVEGQAKSDS
ncbi:MAG TPA: 2-dehydropantoate 2-reductase [Anaerolineales bacterium]|jgi:2-dehydropantoate 2-reductase|nr:2-dehydropantoate 2-reductase [Anaerolineales bacterium]